MTPWCNLVGLLAFCLPLALQVALRTSTSAIKRRLDKGPSRAPFLALLALLPYLLLHLLLALVAALEPTVLHVAPALLLFETGERWLVRNQEPRPTQYTLLLLLLRLCIFGLTVMAKWGTKHVRRRTTMTSRSRELVTMVTSSMVAI